MSNTVQSDTYGLEPLIPLKKVLNEGLIPVSLSTYYAKVGTGEFPDPTKIGNRNFLTPSQIQAIRNKYNPAAIHGIPATPETCFNSNGKKQPLGGQVNVKDRKTRPLGRIIKET